MNPKPSFRPDWRDTAEVLRESVLVCPDCGKHFLSKHSLNAHKGNVATECTPIDD